MQLETRWEGDVFHCAVTGEVDLATAAELRTRLEEGLDRGAKEIRLNLGETTFIDSTGLGVILGRYRRLQESGGRLRVEGATGVVRRLMDLSGLGHLLAEATDRKG